jgi:hypothetical protein
MLKLDILMFSNKYLIFKKMELFMSNHLLHRLYFKLFLECMIMGTENKYLNFLNSIKDI